MGETEPTRRPITAAEWLKTWPRPPGASGRPLVLRYEVPPRGDNRGFVIAHERDAAMVIVGDYELPARFYAFMDTRPRCLLTLVVEGNTLAIEAATFIAAPGAEISTATIRSIKLAGVRQVAGARAARHADTGRPAILEEPGAFSMRQRLYEPPKRGKRLSDDFLRDVARVYREQLAAGQRSPVAAVAKELHGSRSSAGRWVMQARQRGFLGAAEAGRAGEADTDQTKGKDDG